MLSSSNVCLTLVQCSTLQRWQRGDEEMERNIPLELQKLFALLSVRLMCDAGNELIRIRPPQIALCPPQL